MHAALDQFSRRYIDAAIANTIQRIASIPANQSQRNTTLNREVYSLARLIGPNLSEQTVQDAGIKGATANGYIKDHGLNATLATINDAIQKGRQSPRTAPPNKYERKKMARLERTAIAPEQSVIALHPHTTPTQTEPTSTDLPLRTPPDENGKPFFSPGDTDGPPLGQDELRRHLYRRGGITTPAVRCKVKRHGGSFVNWYKVRDTDNRIGWQTAKPSGYVECPYFGKAIDPFDPELRNDITFWPEGERDVEAVTEKLGLPAFTFGGCGDGLPNGMERYLSGRDLVVLADNDAAGRNHAERKAALAHTVSKSIRIIYFPELAGKEDVSDWIASGKQADDLWFKVDSAPLYVPPSKSEDRHIENGRALIIRRASEIIPERIEWLWPSRIAVGKLTLTVGEPGLGKSQLTAFLAAAVTTGAFWPCGEGAAPLGSAIILSAEDDAADTIVPRLIAAGANLVCVEIISAVRKEDGKGRRTFNLKADLDLLEAAITKAKNVRLVIIDPISAYMGETDSHKNTEVRSALEPLGEMASRLRVAMVAVSHLSKGGSTSAINRVIGSIAFVAAARATYMVARDPDDDSQRLFLPIKNNVGPDSGGLAFRIAQILLPQEVVASYIVWANERITQTANEILATSANPSADKSATEEAEELLREILGIGSVPQKKIRSEGDAAGISWASIKRAKRKLGVEAFREGGLGASGRWIWSLPSTKGLKNAYEAQASNVSPLGDFEPLRDVTQP